MAVTYTTIQDRFPEFANTDSDLITAAIANAVDQINEDVWGDKTDQGVTWLTAHFLATSPFGEPARLSDDMNNTRYYIIFKSLRSQVTVGLRNA